MSTNFIEDIIKECFWEYSFNANDISSLSKSQNHQEQMFLFSKILANSKRLFKSMEIFDKHDLERLIESYTLPTFNYDYMARRFNMIEYYFLGKPLTINELKWIA